MMWTIHLMLCALALGGIMDCTGMLGVITETMMRHVKRRGSVVVTTLCTAIFINIIPGDLYLSIVMTGRMYKEVFEDMRLKRKNLSRILEDSATLTSIWCRGMPAARTCRASSASRSGARAVMHLMPSSI